ncbi:MAG: polyphosphate polymerase domain-containing protein [Anaerolineae bacterium]|nr:polyphosphate polymerase domain-containing protein [Anaerolineae bacterium]NUQ03101.1 polyphosphate polymerase domain-containing protein [Anaerolineae bacterium]
MTDLLNVPVERRVVEQLDWAVTHLTPLLAQFQPISLADIQSAALLDRVDTKYIMGVSQLCEALETMPRHYWVLEIQGVRLNRYQTVYFDTDDFVLYQQHHNGFGTRYKVRARKYVDSNLAFFEIKHRTNRQRTIKSRITIPDISLQIEDRVAEFVKANTPYQGQALEPKLWNDYMRVTLVSKNDLERLTLDLNIAFGWNGLYSVLPGVAIAEVKQAHLSRGSEFVQQMTRLGVRPASFSKYTAGVYTLYDQVKHNAFKPQIRRIARLMQSEFSHECSH